MKNASRWMILAPLCLVFSTPWVFYGAQHADCNTSGLTQWLPDNDAHREDYEWFRSKFRSDESVLITWPDCTIDSPLLPQLTDALEKAGGELHADQTSRIFQRIVSGNSVLEELTSPPLKLPKDEAIRRLQGVMIGYVPTNHTEKQHSGTVITPRATAAFRRFEKLPSCILVSLTPHGLAHQRRVVSTIRQIAWDECRVPEADLMIGGRVFEAAAMDQESEQSLRDYVLPITVVSLLIAWFCLRNIRALIAITIIATYCRLLTMALIYYSGGHMSAVLIIAPLLIYVLSVSSALHLANHFFLASAKRPPAESAKQSLAAVWKPCLLATVTTALGLLSLNVSRISPIRSFGQYSTLGLLLAIPVVLSCLPGGLQFTAYDFRRNAAEPGLGPHAKLLSWIAVFVLKNRRWIVTSSLLGVFLCGLGMFRLNGTISFNRMFTPNSEINRNYEWIEQHIGPLGAVEAVLFFPNDSKMTLLRRLKLVSEIDTKLREIPEVGGTLSSATFSPQRGIASGAGRLVQSAVVRKRLPGILRSWNLVADDSSGEHWRIHLRVPALRDDDYSETVSNIQRKIADVLNSPPDRPPNIEVRVTGLVVMVDTAQRTLLADLFRSYACAFLTIFVAMALALRSIRTAVAVMIVNSAPTAVVFGAMGWLSIDVDIASVLTASVALGVALDDTLHFLSWFKQGIQDGHCKHAAIRYALEKCGPAMIQTTLICGLGLAVLVHSDFIPTRRFALLQCLLLFVALSADLVLLPALLNTRFGAVFSRAVKSSSK